MGVLTDALKRLSNDIHQESLDRQQHIEDCIERCDQLIETLEELEQAD